MKDVKGAFALVIVCACIAIASIAALIAERSREQLRLTVPSEQLLPSIRAIQGACLCYVDAIPLDGEEDTAKYWLLTFHTTPSKA